MQTPLERWADSIAATHLSRDATTEASSAGALLPTATARPPVPQRTGTHLPTRGPVRGVCAQCGKPIRAKVHRAAMTGARHAGPGHAPVQTGHVNTPARRRTVAVKATLRHADLLEPELAATMRQLFTDQAKATVDRLNGRRGKQMIRAAHPAGTRDTPPADPHGQPTPIDLTQVFDRAFWTARTSATLGPLYAAIRSGTPDRVHLGLGSTPDPTAAALAQVRTVLTGRSLRLAEQVTQTTADQLAETLNEGVGLGEGIPALAGRVRSIFDDATQNRAEMIARTEVIGSMNEAAFTYASDLGDDVTQDKEWVATDDSRTRETHADADGQTVSMTDPFDVGGFPMQFPGDPDAPADEVINCRCTVVFIPVEQTADVSDTATPGPAEQAA